ncbi:hypothetical protein C0993_012051 [Termitomyces sp. T159_Od127]|nr:hypothetical protein C0993_012051 [Termitomyces sp. T159_Od127]
MPPDYLARVPTSVSYSSSRRDQRFGLTAAPVPSYSGSEFNGQALNPGPPSLQQDYQSPGRYWSDMHTPSNRMPRNYYEGEYASIEELPEQDDSKPFEPDEELQEAERKVKKNQSIAKKVKSVFGKK